MYNEENPLSVSCEAGKSLISKQEQYKIFEKIIQYLIKIQIFDGFKFSKNIRPVLASRPPSLKTSVRPAASPARRYLYFRCTNRMLKDLY